MRAASSSGESRWSGGSGRATVAMRLSWRCSGGIAVSASRERVPAECPPKSTTGKTVWCERSATTVMKSSMSCQAGATSGDVVITSRTRQPLSPSWAALTRPSLRAALARNQPISIIHSPPVQPSRMSSMPPNAISDMPSTCPALAAERSARTRSPCMRHRAACSTRPPSRGDPGSMLKTASTPFIRASHRTAATIRAGPLRSTTAR